MLVVTTKCGQMAENRTHEDFGEKVEIRGSSDRSFGIVFTAFFVIVALWPLRAGAPMRFWAIAVAGVFLIATLTRPAVLHPLNAAWTRFGLLLGKLVSPVVIGVLFFLVVTPIAIMARLFGKDPLRLRLEPSATSYWIERQPAGPAPDTMTNQF